MGSMTLPPGFRFHPTDDELVGYYLKRKCDGLKNELDVIPVLDLYKFEPWELPDKSFLPKRDMEWFFFCPRDRKYPNGSRTNRATKLGYWKATGKDRKVSCEPSVFGVRKTLVFYGGRAPGGRRTDWVMHEYRLCEDLHHGSSNFLGAFALCRVVKRSEDKAKGANSSFTVDQRLTKVPSSLSVMTDQCVSIVSAQTSSPLEISGEFSLPADIGYPHYASQGPNLYGNGLTGALGNEDGMFLLSPLSCLGDGSLTETPSDYMFNCPEFQLTSQNDVADACNTLVTSPVLCRQASGDVDATGFWMLDDGAVFAI